MDELLAKIEQKRERWKKLHTRLRSELPDTLHDEFRQFGTLNAELGKLNHIAAQVNEAVSDPPEV